MAHLDVHLKEYRQGIISWDRFVSRVVSFMHRLMCERHRLNAEERAEIVSDFYPRLPPLVANYKEQGSSFDAYLATSLYHYCRAFVRRKILARRLETPLLLDDESEEQRPELVAEPDPEPLYGNYRSEHTLLQGNGHHETLRRQLLFVFCKNVPLLSPSEVARYAVLLDLPASWVQAIVDYAQRRRNERFQRRTVLQERRDTHFLAMIRAERSARECLDPAHRKHLTERHRFHRRLWLEHIHRLRVQNVHLSHRDLALLFGISKGSIDSAMFVFSRRLAMATARRVPSRHERSSCVKQRSQVHGNQRYSEGSRRRRYRDSSLGSGV